MAKKLKFATILMCSVCCCVHCVVIRGRQSALDLVHDNTDVLCEHPEDGHIERNM
jgi:hypothetical protein